MTVAGPAQAGDRRWRQGRSLRLRRGGHLRRHRAREL